jgi:hypothetical protein
MEETILKKELPDSIELGTPSKGGVLKVYFDSSKPEDAKARISNAAEILNYAITAKNKVEVEK